MKTFLAILVCLGAISPLPAQVTIDSNDHPNLQAALDAIPESGGVLHLRPGEYRISNPLIVDTENTRIEGAGPSAHVINGNTDGRPALILRNREYPANNSARIWRVQLDGFRISGNERSGDGILAQGVQEIFIQGMSIDRHGGHGIHLEQCYEDPRVSDSIITYNAKSGLHITGGHDIVVNGNQFEENLDAVVCLDSFNLCMNGNNLDDHLRHGVVIENTYGSVLSGNMIEECNDTAILLDRDCYGISLSANVIAHHLGGGIKLLDAWGCTVSANTFVLVHNASILVGHSSGRITITGNNFSNSYIGGQLKRVAESDVPMQIDEGTGIRLEGSRAVTITGNTFSGLSTPAVHATSGTRHVIIADNIVEKVAEDQQPETAAFETAEAAGVQIGNNLIPE